MDQSKNFSLSPRPPRFDGPSAGRRACSGHFIPDEEVNQVDCQPKYGGRAGFLRYSCEILNPATISPLEVDGDSIILIRDGNGNRLCITKMCAAHSGLIRICDAILRPRQERGLPHGPHRWSTIVDGRLPAYTRHAGRVGKIAVKPASRSCARNGRLIFISLASEPNGL